ncbi:MAG: RDD family protein [Sphingomicrobium sp.]
MADRRLQPLDLSRTFITPEGVDLRLQLGSAGSRAAAFLIDTVLMALLLAAVTVALLLMAVPGATQFLVILWLIGFFVLRNGWFSLFEMGSRGATPGKRIMGLRVVARDGARLTGAAVIARNAMREIEIFLPLSFLAQQTAKGTADTFLILFALVWSGIFLFFPLFNRDRLRVGDLVAGTWVVRTSHDALSEDLVGSAPRNRQTFSAANLGLYGIYELQTLERVLRADQPEAIATVARTIRDKAGLPDDGDDYGFLSDFYAALCGRLETEMLVGRRRESKYAA